MLQIKSRFILAKKKLGVRCTLNKVIIIIIIIIFIIIITIITIIIIIFVLLFGWNSLQLDYKVWVSRKGPLYDDSRLLLWRRLSGKIIKFEGVSLHSRA